MKNGYKTIFWGIFFITFHINLGQFKILPVFIGLLIVANGIKKLEFEYHSDKFIQANTFANIAALISLTGGILSLFAYSNVLNTSLPQFIWLIAFSIIELLMEYRILDGTVAYMLFCNDLNDANFYTNVTRKYIIAFMIYILLQCILLTMALDSAVLLNTVFAIILRIRFMQIMSHLKNFNWNKESVTSI